MQNKGFGHLKTRLFTIKTSKSIGFGGPMETNSLQLKIDAYLEEDPFLFGRPILRGKLLVLGSVNLRSLKKEKELHM